nr:MAG TPA: hypothetical protein [Caudoviricetes sp.]
MRLIDVDDLGVGRCSRDVVPAVYCAGWNGLLRLIEKAPTVDAEIVVRCKDCYQSVVIGDVLYCAYWGKNTDENGYCHEGG